MVVCINISRFIMLLLKSKQSSYLEVAAFSLTLEREARVDSLMRLQLRLVVCRVSATTNKNKYHGAKLNSKEKMLCYSLPTNITKKRLFNLVSDHVGHQRLLPLEPNRADLKKHQITHHAL